MPGKWLVCFGKPLVSISRVTANSNPAMWAPLSVKSGLSNPALQFAQHELADHVHAGLGVVQAGNEGELLAAIVLEDLGVLLRDFFQRLEAIGRKSGGDDGDAPHAFPGQPLHGL